MKSVPPREIGLSDLAQLTLRANVVFAVRCAQRLRPCFELAVAAPCREDQMAAVDDALAAALAFCRDEVAMPGRAAALAALAGVVAHETCESTRFAGYAAVRAAEAAGYAEAYDAQPSDAGFVDVIAAAFGAGRVLAVNADRFTLDLAVADFDGLRRLAASTDQNVGPAIDPSEAGPLGLLWPHGRPDWISPLDAACPVILSKWA